jgi:hypothetical protein
MFTDGSVWRGGMMIHQPWQYETMRQCQEVKVEQAEKIEKFAVK